MLSQENPSAPTFRVFVLGRFRVERDGSEIRVAPGRASTLFQRLALNGGAIHRDRLMEELWPDTPVVTADTRLRNLLASVRRQTGANIEGRGPSITWSDSIWCDLDEFIRLASRAVSGDVPLETARALCLQAQALWLGAPLEDQRYTPWAEGLRRRANDLQERMWMLLDKSTE